MARKGRPGEKVPWHSCGETLKGQTKRGSFLEEERNTQGLGRSLGLKAGARKFQVNSPTGTLRTYDGGLILSLFNVA